MLTPISDGTRSAVIGNIDTVLVPIGTEASPSSGILKPCSIQLNAMTKVLQFPGIKMIANLGLVFAFELEAHERKVFYEGGHRDDDDDDGESDSFTVPIPNLVFLWHVAPESDGDSRGFRVLVHSSDDKDYAHLVAFEVANVYSDGRVCFGSNPHNGSLMTAISLFLGVPFNADLDLDPVFINGAGWDKLGTDADDIVNKNRYDFFQAWSELDLRHVDTFPPPKDGKHLTDWMLKLMLGRGTDESATIQIAGVNYLAVRKDSVSKLLSMKNFGLHSRALMHVPTATSAMRLWPLSVKDGLYEAHNADGRTLPVHTSSKLHKAEALKLMYFWEKSGTSADAIRAFKQILSGQAAPDTHLDRTFRLGDNEADDALLTALKARWSTMADEVVAKARQHLGQTLTTGFGHSFTVIAESAPTLFHVKINDIHLVVDSLRLAQLWRDENLDDAYAHRATPRGEAISNLAAATPIMLMPAHGHWDASQIRVIYFTGDHPLAHPMPYVAAGNDPNVEFLQFRHVSGRVFNLPRRAKGLHVGYNALSQGWLKRNVWGAWPYTVNSLDGSQRDLLLVLLLQKPWEETTTIRLKVSTSFEFRSLFLPRGTVIELRLDNQDGARRQDFLFRIMAIPDHSEAMDATQRRILDEALRKRKSYKATISSSSLLVQNATLTEDSLLELKEFVLFTPRADAMTVRGIHNAASAVGIQTSAAPENELRAYASEQVALLERGLNTPEPLIRMDPRPPVKKPAPYTQTPVAGRTNAADGVQVLEAAAAQGIVFRDVPRDTPTVRGF